MAITDWPLDRAFLPADMSFGSSTSKSGFAGFYSGDMLSTGHLSDRLTCTLTLGPVKSAIDAGRRSALLKYLDSSGDLVRFGPLQKQRAQLGSIAGTPTVAVDALAAATSVIFSGCLAGANLMTGGSFEIDSNADGLADGWTIFTTGSTGSVTASRNNAPLIPGSAGSWSQRIDAAALNGQAGVTKVASAVTVGVSYALSVDKFASSGANVYISIGWETAGGSYISESVGFLSSALGRVSVVGVAPATAAQARIYLLAASAAGTAAFGYFDNVQFERATAATPHTGFSTLLADDCIACNGNLLFAAIQGAEANDAGRMTVPLSLRLQRPIASGDSVVLTSPTGLWRLATDGISMDYSAGRLQRGIALPFRQEFLT